MLGIAANLVLRRQQRQIKRRQREPLALDLTAGPLSEEEIILDRLRSLARQGPDEPDRLVESEDTVAYLLAPLQPDDRHLIRLAILLGMSRKSIGRELGVSAVTVRVRLHRALNRLRDAWDGERDE
jgi:RNA polymerase sigma factor (sigma-70 family)